MRRYEPLIALDPFLLSTRFCTLRFALHYVILSLGLSFWNLKINSCMSSMVGCLVTLANFLRTCTGRIFAATATDEKVNEKECESRAYWFSCRASSIQACRTVSMMMPS